MPALSDTCPQDHTVESIMREDTSLTAFPQGINFAEVFGSNLDILSVNNIMPFLLKWSHQNRPISAAGPRISQGSCFFFSNAEESLHS